VVVEEYKIINFHLFQQSLKKTGKKNWCNPATQHLDLTTKILFKESLLNHTLKTLAEFVF
jgi:hypothetical protein